jgi:guanine deaminase
MKEKDKNFMLIAIELSLNSVKNKGGPFGAVIVKDGKFVAKTSNSVTLSNDPTAHAEINAIRAACSALKTFDLSGCTIYTSCEPCPMCLGAIYWARIDKIFYANNRIDAKNIGFDDSFIYDELAKPMSERSIPTMQIMHNEAIKAFEAWKQKTDKIEY